LISRTGAPSVTMRWLMTKAQAAQIAKRLRDLRDASKKTDNPITVPMLAKHCQVAVRTAAGWLSAKNPKPMTYQHAVKAAKLFRVEVEWLWDGKERRPVPDLMGRLTSYDKALKEVEEKVAGIDAGISPFSDRLDQIEQGVAKLLELAGTSAVSQVADDLTQAQPQPRSQAAPKQASSAKKARAAKRRAG
jgi:hypothetical protein